MVFPYLGLRVVSDVLWSRYSQSYPDVEFLVIDDASDDNTLEILKSLQRGHFRGNDLRIITHNRNLGVSETRNHIIEEATGDYLYFIDSDDVIDKNTISLLMSQIEKYDADIVFGSYERIDLSGNRSFFQYPMLLFEDSDSFAAYVYKEYAGFQASACNYLMRLSLVRRNNLKFYESDFWEDMVFTYNIVTMTERAVLLPDITYTYICRENSLSNSWHQERIDKNRIVQFFRAIEQLKITDSEIKQKSYYPSRCCIALMSDFYIICNIIKKSKYIYPSFDKKELKKYMKHPASLREILTFRQCKIRNLLFWCIGNLSPYLFIKVVKFLAKFKGLL